MQVDSFLAWTLGVVVNDRLVTGIYTCVMISFSLFRTKLDIPAANVAVSQVWRERWRPGRVDRHPGVFVGPVSGSMVNYITNADFASRNSAKTGSLDLNKLY